MPMNRRFNFETGQWPQLGEQAAHEHTCRQLCHFWDAKEHQFAQMFQGILARSEAGLIWSVIRFLNLNLRGLRIWTWHYTDVYCILCCTCIYHLPRHSNLRAHKVVPKLDPLSHLSAPSCSSFTVQRNDDWFCAQAASAIVDQAVANLADSIGKSLGSHFDLLPFSNESQHQQEQCEFPTPYFHLKQNCKQC